jgi:hydroxymethylbilane synthase
MATEHKIVHVGSRKSQLALIQTNSVIAQLKTVYPSYEFVVVTMTTTGDNILDTALSKIGEKSLFTKELEVALIDRHVDFVVHSLKDLPTELPANLVVGAVCKRDDPRDALVLRANQTQKDLSLLTPGSVIGTSSLRRAAQLRRKFPHLQINDIRGNLNTRLRKLDDEASVYTGLILAVAGLERMEWKQRISSILSPDDCMYAVGQGAMAVECRADDLETLTMLSVLTDPATLLQCIAERAFLRRLEGGCSVPVAVMTELHDNQLTLHGGVFSIPGTEAVVGDMSTSLDQPEDISSHSTAQDQNWSDKSYAAIVAAPSIANSRTLSAAESLGISLADKLMVDGAADILNAAKRQTAEEILRQKAAKAAAAAGLTENITAS